MVTTLSPHPRPGPARAQLPAARPLNLGRSPNSGRTIAAHPQVPVEPLQSNGNSNNSGSRGRGWDKSGPSTYMLAGIPAALANAPDLRRSQRRRSDAMPLALLLLLRLP